MQTASPPLEKGPNDSVLIKFDWGALRLPTGVTISSSTVPPVDGLTIGSPSTAGDGRSVSVLISGGTLSRTYEVTNSITTSQGEVFEAIARVRIVKPYILVA